MNLLPNDLRPSLLVSKIDVSKLKLLRAVSLATRREVSLTIVNLCCLESYSNSRLVIHTSYFKAEAGLGKRERVS
jgi:hypothetical protein